MNVRNRWPETVAEALSLGVDARSILADVLGCERSWVFAHGEAILSRSHAQRVAFLCERRAAGVPLAYLLGSVGFYGREFEVNESVLVPRPETEHLVDEALAFLKTRTSKNPTQQVTVLDVGVGSGAIACTIAAEYPKAFVEGTDTSSEAVKLAQRNARRLGVADRCRMRHGRFAFPGGERTFDAVVANLPYIPSADVPTPPDSAGFEPREALDGGADGLALYREFLATAPRLLKPRGLLVLEAAPPVIGGLAELVSKAFECVPPEIGKDYAGLERYVKLIAP